MSARISSHVKRTDKRKLRRQITSFKKIHPTFVQTLGGCNQAYITSQKYRLLITNDYISLLLFIHYLQCAVIFYRHGNGVKINAELQFVSFSILFSRQASKER